MSRYWLMVFRFLMFAAAAFVVWEIQDFAASFAATEMTTETKLRTTEERDDARVLRAFEASKKIVHSRVTLVTESNPQQQTRDATLTLTAASKGEVLADRTALVEAMQTAFSHEGKGELFDVGHAPHATPVPNGSMTTIKQVCQGLALVLLAIGLITLLWQWKHSRLPVAALLGAIATVLTIFLSRDHDSAIAMPLIMAALPAAFLALMIYVTMRVKKAARWQEGRARITQSMVKAERHRFQGDTTTVKNTPSVTYEFEVAGQTIQGDRISIGMAPADEVDQVIKRYAVGREVPVFYDPENPEDCVLERKPPLSLGCLWTGAAVVLLVYFAVALSLWNGTSVSALFDRVFPQVHHPLVVAITGVLGVLLVIIGIWNRLHPRKMFPWLRTQGVIVSSEVESYRENTSSSNSSSRTFYKAVVEYRYEVEGQEYHGILGAGSPITISTSGNQASAEATAAKYPAGMAVEVCYNPQKPAQSGLDIDTELMITGTSTLVVGAVLLAIAAYAASH